jgi:hypothetical protein
MRTEPKFTKAEVIVAVPAIIFSIAGYLIEGNNIIYTAGTVLFVFFMLLVAYSFVRGSAEKEPPHKIGSDRKMRTSTIIIIESVAVVAILIILWKASVF